MDAKLREKLRKLLKDMELSHDNACGDPDCCGERTYFVGGEGLEKALDAIAAVVRESLPSTETSSLDWTYGFNYAIDEVRKAWE